MAHSMSTQKQPLNIAVLTVSDTRNYDTDSSGQYLAEAVANEGHQLLDRALIKDDIYEIRAQVSSWVARADIQVIVITGGTGFTDRDSTPEAIKPLLDKEVEGFGEMFRHVSWQEIGTSTMQSRALAGLANKTLIACLPGSTGACRTGWSQLLQPQLDSNQGPCNFVAHLSPVAPLTAAAS